MGNKLPPAALELLVPIHPMLEQWAFDVRLYQALVIHRLESCNKVRAENRSTTVGPCAWLTEPDLLAWHEHGYACLLVRSELGYWLAYLGASKPWTDTHLADFDRLLLPHKLYTNIGYGPHQLIRPPLADTPFAALHWTGFDGAQNDGLAPFVDGGMDEKRQRERPYHRMTYMALRLSELALAAKNVAIAQKQ